MIYLLALLYLILCLLVAFLGRGTRIGYLGTAVLSVVLTPFLVFILLLLLRPRIEEPADEQPADK